MNLIKKSKIHYLFVLSVGLYSCSTTKSTQNEYSKADYHQRQNPKFIDGISIHPNNEKASRKTRLSGVSISPKKQDESLSTTVNSYKTNIESATYLQAEYAQRLDIPIEQANDVYMYRTIEHWYGTPYSLGGYSESGIDCSGFSKHLFSDLYNIQLPRTAQEQYNNSAAIDDKSGLKKGDLVFFGSSKNHITHVGIYLTNNKFVHASTSRGVMISDLDDSYWNRKYVSAGRYLDSYTAR